MSSPGWPFVATDDRTTSPGSRRYRRYTAFGRALRIAAYCLCFGWCVATTTEKICAGAEPFQLTPEARQDTTEQPSKADDAPPIDAKADSRRHFQSGINLYEDKNWAAALAEFEAAYRQYPSAAALQNVALCQKQLYRYSDTRESLVLLLRDHREELEKKDLSAISDSIRELSSLIGSVRLSVVPASAKVLLDGRSISPAEATHPIVLDVGEHHISAEAPGFAPMVRHFRIAGGHTDVPLVLTLAETTGTVVITAPDAQTAIAVDGRAVAFAEWTGRLEPGRHFVQIYREGYEPFEEEIDVEVATTTHVKGILGDKLDRSELGAAPQNTGRRGQTGYYGLIGLATSVVRGQPAGFVAATDYAIGWSWGFRGGYRLLAPVGIEVAFESGTFAVTGHCQSTSLAASCSTTMEDTYHIEARRFGGGIRLYSSNETLRLTGMAGGGVVSHDYRDSTHLAAGINPYATFEVGIQANWRHTLWELYALALIDGASNIRSGAYRPYAEGNGINLFGIGVRVGWGDWVPGHSPLPPMPPQKMTPKQ